MKHFLRNESGAVTVDWVVLTAGLVGLGLATMAVVSTGVQDVSEDIDDQLQDNNIIQTAFGPDLLGILEQWHATAYIQNSGGTTTAQQVHDTTLANIANYPPHIVQASYNTHTNTLADAELKVAAMEGFLPSWDPDNPDYTALAAAFTAEGAYVPSDLQRVIEQSEGLENYLAMQQINVEMQRAILHEYEAGMDARGISY